MSGYIKRVTSGGITGFLRKIVNAKFGIIPFKREIGLLYARRKLISDFRARRIDPSTPSYPILKNRLDLQALLGAPALINDDELKVFEKYSAEASETIVEIGCAYGGSSLLFLMYKRDEVNVYSIDPFIKDSMGSFQAEEDACREKVTKALKLIGMGRRAADWTLIPDYSFNVVKTFQNKVDVLFVDGDHQYEAVKQDFEDWFPLLKAGGIIFFHDSARPIDAPSGKALKGWPGPTKFVSELRGMDGLDFIEQVWSITVFRKSK